jgi:hypothetical protein
LACARIGDAFDCVRSFSASAPVDRISDASANGYHCRRRIQARNNREPEESVDEALNYPAVENIIVIQRPSRNYYAHRRDHWYHELMQSVDDMPCQQLDSEHLFILYTFHNRASRRFFRRVFGAGLHHNKTCFPMFRGERFSSAL